MQNSASAQGYLCTICEMDVHGARCHHKPRYKEAFQKGLLFCSQHLASTRFLIILDCTVKGMHLIQFLYLIII